MKGESCRVGCGPTSPAPCGGELGPAGDSVHGQGRANRSLPRRENRGPRSVLPWKEYWPTSWRLAV